MKYIFHLLDQFPNCRPRQVRLSQNNISQLAVLNTRSNSLNGEFIIRASGK